MSETTVASVVQKALSTAPAAKAEDKPDATKAPNDTTPHDKDGSSSADASSDQATLTSFEQELVSELDADEQSEFEGLSVQEQRSRLDWMKKRYRRETRQRTEDGKIRKAWSALVTAGVSADDLRALVSKRQGATTQAEADKADAAIKRGFQRKLSEAKDAEEREAIQDAEQTVRELVEDEVEKRLGQRVKPLEDRIEVADRRQQEARRKSLDTEINDLEDKEGFKASLVESYRDDIRALGLRHPDWSAWKLLHYLATEEELKQGRRVNGAPSKDPARPSPVVKKSVTSTTPSQTPTRARSGTSLERLVGNILRRK